MKMPPLNLNMTTPQQTPFADQDSYHKGWTSITGGNVNLSQPLWENPLFILAAAGLVLYLLPGNKKRRRK